MAKKYFEPEILKNKKGQKNDFNPEDILKDFQKLQSEALKEGKKMMIKNLFKMFLPAFIIILGILILITWLLSLLPTPFDKIFIGIFWGIIILNIWMTYKKFKKGFFF